MIGLEHWLYCLGCADRCRSRSCNLILLSVIGLGLIWDFRLRAHPADRLRLAVLLCLYSCVFLYHRSYDSVIVALPLFYCVSRARDESQRRAIAYKLVATGLMLVINFPRGGVLIRVSNWSQSSGLAGQTGPDSRLPCCTWILLASMFLLWYFGRGPHVIAPAEETN